MTAYHDLDSPREMRTDAAAVGAHLPLSAPRRDYTDLYAGFPTDQPKRQVPISEAAQRIANALSLHLD